MPKPGKRTVLIPRPIHRGFVPFFRRSLLRRDMTRVYPLHSMSLSRIFPHIILTHRAADIHASVDPSEPSEAWAESEGPLTSSSS
jgi:hypothetical protein